MAPANHPSGRFAWQNGCPALWGRSRASLEMTVLIVFTKTLSLFIKRIIQIIEFL